jgi:phenylacetate-CoA ligase
MVLGHRLTRAAIVGVAGRWERRIPFWSEERIRRIQERRIRAIVAHAYRFVPFYRRVMREAGLRPGDFRCAEDLERLPLIDGARVAQNPEDFMSARIPESSRRILYSTGSGTRIRRLIAWERSALLRQTAMQDRDRAVLYRLVGREWGISRVSLFPMESTTHAVTRYLRDRVFVPRWHSRTAFLSPNLPIDEVVAQLNAIAPDVVFSYGSYAETFFHAVADQGLALRTPRVWVYGADRLSAPGRAFIEERFGCIVYSTYSAVETGRLGFQCEHRNGFHLNVDRCAVRLADAGGRTVQAGTIGEVVVSNLVNRAMVLLNYRLGDRGIMATSACGCGRSLPVLQHVVGRTSDVLHLADGRSLPDFMLVQACRSDLRDVLRSQIVEEGAGRFRWRIVPRHDVDRSTLETGLLRGAQAVLGPADRLAIEFVQALPTHDDEKLRRVVHEDGWTGGEGESCVGGAR